MDSSIDLSQPEIVSVGKRPEPKEISTSSNFNNVSNFRRSCDFRPMHHPYEWNAKKPLKPIKNNPISRFSEEVNPKITEVKHDSKLYSKRIAFKDPRARASELLQKNGYNNFNHTQELANKKLSPINTESVIPNTLVSFLPNIIR